jgi:YD repeat-containing protein
LNQETTYTYTSEGRLESVTDPLGNTTSYTYDSYGQKTSMTDPLGNTWTYTYDSLGRLINTTDPLGHVTHNEYDLAGRLIKVTQNYDPNKTQNEDAVWNIVAEYAYDVRGNQISVTDTFGRTTVFEYDSADRLIKTTDPAGNESINTYNSAGQLIATTDALGRTTEYQYDAAGRLISTTDALGNVTSTAYNPDGTVLSTTDALGRTTSYLYDDVKRVTTVTLPNGSQTHNTYDESGNLLTTTEHPFYVETKGWTNAEDLQLGDEVRNADGETGEVEFIEFEQTSQEMYNLTVDEAHTFFVGDGQWLVHNACRQLDGSVSDDIIGNFFVDEAIRYHKQLPAQPSVTIGVTIFDNIKYVSINGNANKRAIEYLKKILNAEDVNLVIGSGKPPFLHAEGGLYRHLVYPDKIKIGISNSSGPCSEYCLPFFEGIAQFRDVEIFYPLKYWK